MGKAVEAGFSVVFPHAAVADAAEGQVRGRRLNHSIINDDRPGLGFLGKLLVAIAIGGKQVYRQWAGLLVNVAQHAVELVVGHDGLPRSKISSCISGEFNGTSSITVGDR